MSQTNICEIESELLDTLKKFRFSKKKENHGIVMKVTTIREAFNKNKSYGPLTILD